MSIFSLFSQSLVKEDYIFFDVETTGLNPFMQDKIVEIAMIKTSKGNIVDSLTSMINPGVPIPNEVSQINNITDNMVKDAPALDKKFGEKIVAFIGENILVAHNAGFDLGFLSAELARCGIVFERWRAIDTLKIAKTIFPGQKNKLEAIMRRYNIMPEGDLHRALIDTDGLRKIFFEFLEEAEIRNKSLDEIIKEFGFTGFNIHKFIPGQIREAIIENKNISGKYKKRDGSTVNLNIIPVAPVWSDNKWFLLSRDSLSNNEIILYCENFVEFF